jgi:hypothetical protein
VTLKERVLKRIEAMDEAELTRLEAHLERVAPPSEEELERRLQAWRGIFGMLSDPAEYAEFEKHAARRPLFSKERTLALEAELAASERTRNEP